MTHDHIRLYIPGPSEVRSEILQAQTEWMIGHRSPAFAELYARTQPKLQQSFFTENPVYLFTSSGTGIWEAASRNGVRDEGKILHLVCGAFSKRWAQVSELNGKTVDRIEVPMGETILPKQLADALKKDTYDAVACVYNETSTGVLNPVAGYAEVLKDYPDTLFFVDAVSAYLGAPIYTDKWGLDICLTSSQKAMALPPGIAFGVVTPRVLERAKTIQNRGYYFDLLEIDAKHQKNNTPATPPIALLYAADKQLDDVMAEGLENRFARHQKMQDMTHAWGEEAGFEFFAPEGYRSPTLTVFENTRNIDIKALNAFLHTRGMEIANGYGSVKNKTFRIAHMGDLQPEHMEELFVNINDFLAKS